MFNINDNNYATITQERDVDKLGFYSKALEVIEKMPQKKGTGEQFLKYLEGKVKKDELLWTGVEDYKNTDKVTKDELLALRVLTEYMLKKQNCLLLVSQNRGKI